MDAGGGLQPASPGRSFGAMSQPPILRVYLHPPLLHTARAGRLGLLNRLQQVLFPRGWQIEIAPSGEAARARAPDLPGYALFNMERPPHDRALTFRLAYHYPFWQIERQAERWRWPVAQSVFVPDSIDAEAAGDFATRLRARVLPGPAPVVGDYVLIALQGQLRRQRSFQAASPLAMVRAVAETGRPCHATLHPSEEYSAEDRAALADLAAQHTNLTIGGNSAVLLRDCAFVATQNSAVAFDGYILGKPAVLFAQVDFHHIGLNVSDIGIAKALARAQYHRPDYARYLDWFLRQHALDMMAADIDQRLIATLARHGWPV